MCHITEIGQHLWKLQSYEKGGHFLRHSVHSSEYAHSSSYVVVCFCQPQEYSCGVCTWIFSHQNPFNLSLGKCSNKELNVSKTTPSITPIIKADYHSQNICHSQMLSQSVTTSTTFSAQIFCGILLLAE